MVLEGATNAKERSATDNVDIALLYCRQFLR